MPHREQIKAELAGLFKESGKARKKPDNCAQQDQPIRISGDKNINVVGNNNMIINIDCKACEPVDLLQSLLTDTPHSSDRHDGKPCQTKPGKGIDRGFSSLSVPNRVFSTIEVSSLIALVFAVVFLMLMVPNQ